MRKINSPLLVFPLTYVNEDLISLMKWKRRDGMLRDDNHIVSNENMLKIL